MTIDRSYGSHFHKALLSLLRLQDVLVKCNQTVRAARIRLIVAGLTQLGDPWLLMAVERAIEVVAQIPGDLPVEKESFQALDDLLGFAGSLTISLPLPP